MREIQLKNRVIGENHPLFIVAEVGVTCNYDMQISRELIDVVHESGADGIKFLLNYPEEVMSNRDEIYEYDTVEGKKQENLFDMFQSLQFTLDQWRELKAYADQKDVVLFSTVSCPTAIQIARELDFELLKISSWDYTYRWLWETVGGMGKPVIMDTGPVHPHEIARALHWMKETGDPETILVHCFHTGDHRQMNMRSLPYMRNAFNTLVGYSARDLNDEQDYIAVALGAVFLEKRLTMSRKLPGHHHILSKQPEEFIEYVKNMRNARASLGSSNLVPSESDLKERKRWFRHIVANRDLKEGTVLTADMLEGKRPEAGISPEYLELFIGRTLKRDVLYNEALTWEMV